MPNQAKESPADKAGRVALARLFACIDERRSFRLEAGAGAGKTYSLIEALQRLIDQEGPALLRARQQIACITYTNVAKDEITSRTHQHRAVLADTVHAFCWSILKDFQSHLRTLVPQLVGWPERIEEAGGLGNRPIQYELGLARVGDEAVTLGHDDVLALMVLAMENKKFRMMVPARYPIIFIDEYQDTDASFIEALKRWYLDTGEGPLLGFFGDHWQKIYGDGCGKLEHAALDVIDKNANFRSVGAVVRCLNGMRPELLQMVSDPEAAGEARVFHANSWPGQRRTGAGGGHWKGDVSPEAAKAYLEHLRARLTCEGWNFDPRVTKILMLSHSILAKEQGYPNIPPIYKKRTDPWLKKKDPHIKFFTDHLEPACAAYAAKRYGKMFEAFGADMPRIRNHAAKVEWAQTMDALLALRLEGTIGQVVDHIRGSGFMHLPKAVEEREAKLVQAGPAPVDGESSSISRLRLLHKVAYAEVIALNRFIDGHTPFATKHGVKGAQFENVLVVVGRGWNEYNFGEMLEWAGAGGPPPSKAERFESNRNLFYVACSRPKVRLALLFTQELSDGAMSTIRNWFGADQVIALPAVP